MPIETDTATTRLEALYRERFHEFLRVTTAICGDAERGRDALQEGFAQAMRSLARYHEEGLLDAWVWQIVINQAKKQRRRREAPLAPEPSMNGHRSDADTEVRAAIAELPERQRHVLFLRYYADLDYGAIADALKITPGTVGATLYQAHAALRKRFQETSP